MWRHRRQKGLLYSPIASQREMPMSFNCLSEKAISMRRLRLRSRHTSSLSQRAESAPVRLARSPRKASASGPARNFMRTRFA